MLETLRSMRLSKLFLPFVVALYTAGILGITTAYAAEIVAEAPSEIGVGDTFTITFELSTGAEPINALEATLRYPENLLELKEVRDGNSIINLWIDSPALDGPGAVRFAGITPGGFHGQHGEIFTLVFEAVRSGQVSIRLDNASAYRNTGDGIATTFLSRIPSFTVKGQGSGASIESLAETDDVPPETFTPVVATDPSLFEGKAFVVFVTQDKGSGIERYEVSERKGFVFPLLKKPVWVEAVSPFMLSDQTRMSYIYVKAIDQAGNERIARLSPAQQFFYFSETALVAILLMLIISILISYVRKRRSR